MEWKHLSYSDISTHSVYVVFVLEELLNVLECISVKGKEDQKYKEEETEVTEFLKTFEKLYRLFSHPKKRMWQSISVSNTHEIGLTLKMLRKAMGLSAAKVSAANPDNLTARQIEKIEAGTHRPSGRNYEMLMQFYHKTGLEGSCYLRLIHWKCCTRDRKLLTLLYAKNGITHGKVFRALRKNWM